MNYFYDDLFYITINVYLLTVNQMDVVLNYYQPSKFTFLTIEKICAVLNGVKCVVMNDKCVVLNDAQR